MDEGPQLLESFGQHEMPDLWPDIQERSLRVEMVAESPRGTIPSPLRGRFRLVLGIMAAALAIALLGVVALWPKGTRTPHSLEPNVRLVVFTTGDNKITARITDPLAAASQLSAVFQQLGLNVIVKAIPVSPSLVGTIVYSDVPSIRSLHEGTCLGGGTSCEVGIVIPADFHGQANVVVGRAAQANETFHSSADVFGPGEVLHCSGILGNPSSGRDPCAPTKKPDGASVGGRRPDYDRLSTERIRGQRYSVVVEHRTARCDAGATRHTRLPLLPGSREQGLLIHCRKVPGPGDGETSTSASPWLRSGDPYRS